MGGGMGIWLAFFALPSAWAQQPGGFRATSEHGDQVAQAGVTAGPTSLDVHSDSPDVDAEALRRAVAQELGVEVVLAGSELAARAIANVTISYRPGARELAVSYASATHGTVTRIVEAPTTPSEVVTTAALLVGNLARDQVATPPPAPVSAAPTPPVVVPEPTKAPLPAPKVEWLRAPRERFANASFFFPLATNIDDRDLRTHLSFNLIFGHVGELRGLELGTVNTVGHTLEGVELGLLGNWVGGPASGLQLSGIFNVAKSLEGLQVAPGLNYFAHKSSGGQVSMLANVGGEQLTGFQLAPLNVAGDVEGTQIGIINVAGKVTGLQLGLINVADDVKGVPIGLLSVTRSGGVHPMLWSSTSTYGNVALKFATRYTYTFVSVSLHREHDYTQGGPGLGVGFSVPIVKDAFFEPDISALHLFGNTTCCRTRFFGAWERRHDQSQFKLRAAFRYEALKHLSVFIGGSVVGHLRYPLDAEGSTLYPFSTNVEAFGGLQL